MSADAVEHFGYTSGLQHIADELRLLDMRIAELLRQLEPRSRFSGLVVADSEIKSLLAHPRGPLECNDTLEAGKAFEAQISAAARAAADRGVFLPLPELAARFQLTRLEERLIVICLAEHVDRKYGKLFGYIHDDLTRQRPTIGLLLDLACGSAEDPRRARAALAPGSPLVRRGLVNLHVEEEPIVRRPVMLDDRIADYLLEIPTVDPRIAPRRSFDELMVPAELTERLRAFFARHARSGSEEDLDALFYLRGRPGTEARQLAEAICTELGIPLLACDAAPLLEPPDAGDARLSCLVRESMLVDAAICLENCDGLIESTAPLLQKVLDATAGRLTFLTGSASWATPRALGRRHFAEVELPFPARATRLAKWQRELSSILGAQADGATLATRFRFTPGQIEAASAEAARRAWWHAPDGRVDTPLLSRICRTHSTPRLGALAQRIEPGSDWRQLVLPDDAHRHLRELCDHARFRDTVFGDWGFEERQRLGKGLNALFCGPPGTGKTLAAEVVANELGSDLYRIDLSQVVSKFIGETEKQLRQLFDEAQGSDSILLFDEADALFGKRSEVKDSHDRYSNIEIGYLLQRMDEYDGIAILATNMRRSLDDAFTRRLRFIVEFPFPEPTERARIWRAHLTSRVPLAQIEVEFLAASFKLSGASIRNVVLAAAFQAAACDLPVGMREIVRAIRREFQKMGRTCVAAEFGTFAGLLAEGAA